MKKIILIEDVSVLKHRLEIVLTKHSLVQVESLDSKLLLRNM